jgi:sialidase-1
MACRAICVICVLAGAVASAPTLFHLSSAKDFTGVTGGASITANPKLNLRSGSPNTHTTAAVALALPPGVVVTSVAFNYRYCFGWSTTGPGANFTLQIAKKVAYASPGFTDYPYSKSDPVYSPPVNITLAKLSIAVPSSGLSRIEFDFVNTGRNVQLLLPMTIAITCAGGSCLKPTPAPIPTPPPTPAPTRSMGNVTVLFEDGDKDDRNHTWACVRGAALVRAPNNSLLAFSGGGSSCTDGDVGFGILLRSSHDNGTTWTPIQYVAGDYHSIGGYSAPIVDKQRKTVLLLYNRKYVETWLTRSTDNGVTWSAAVNMTDVIGSANCQLGFGGVQLSNGRLVVAVHGTNGTAALFSDDGGQNWQHGKPVKFPADGSIANGGESQLVDDKRGPLGLTMTIRVSSKNVLMNHAIAQSDDGGETWGMARVVTQLTGPTCQGSISRLDDGRLLMSAPHYQRWRYAADRKNMTVMLFKPEHGINTTNGTSGTLEVEAMQQIWSGPAAYSGLSPDGQFVMFEGGYSYRYASTMIARITL